MSLKKIFLITINGKCRNVTKFRADIAYKKTAYFVVKKVRNFVTIDLLKLRISICAYSRGCFKITVSRSDHFKSIISRVELVISRLSELFHHLYAAVIGTFEAKISQIAVSIIPPKYQVPKNRLTYQLLKTEFPIEKNEIFIQIKRFVLVHKINWVNYAVLEFLLSYFGKQ